MDRKDLLSEAVQDLRVSGNTTLKELMKGFSHSGGFTSAKVATAFSIMKKMFDEENTTFLSFPADIIATGTRGVINDLVKRHLIDVIITTNGTLDHDIARTYMKYYSGSFDYSDREPKDPSVMPGTNTGIEFFAALYRMDSSLFICIPNSRISSAPPHSFFFSNALSRNG